MKEQQSFTNKHIRENNVIHILTDIVNDANITRQELSKRNEISLVTVKHIVDDLIEREIVEEHLCDSVIGRKPKALKVSHKYGNVICFNLTSAETICYIIYDVNGEKLIGNTFRFHSGETDYEQNLKNVVSEVLNQVQEIGTQTIGIAAFVPSAYYEEKDFVNYDLIPEFKNFHIKHFFEQYFAVNNIRILHDVIPASKAEYESYSSGTDSQFYVYCGFGVGGCFIHEGMAVLGENLVAGEVGKIIVSGSRLSGRIKTFEEVVSVPGILKASRNHFPDIEFEELLERYEAGEEELVKILDAALDTAARTFYNLVWIYNPTRIIIDSCYPQYAMLMKQRLEQYLEKFCYGSISADVDVNLAKYDEYHMMKGCFHLVRETWVEEMVSKL